MAPTVFLRAFEPADAAAVNAVALEAFGDFKDEIGDWPTFAEAVARMSSLAESSEIIVATVEGHVAGAVAYVAPGVPKQEWFKTEWPVVRMLVVAHAYRGQGIGRILTEECIRRAQRDAAPLIALHTTPIMTTAVVLYERMGFRYLCAAPQRWGIPYGIYVKQLGSDAAFTKACDATSDARPAYQA